MSADRSGENRGYLAEVVRRRYRILAVLAVLGAAAGVGAALVVAPVHTASAIVLVSPLDGNPYSPQGRGDDLINLETEAQLVISDSVATLAARRARGDLGGTVSVVVPVNTQVIEISYTAATRESARTGAQTFADAYLEYRQQRAEAVVDGRVQNLEAQARRVEEDLRVATEQLAATPTAERTFLSQRVVVYTNQLGLINEQLNDVTSTSINPGQVITPAELPSGGGGTRMLIFGLAGAAALLGLGLVALLARECLRRRLTDAYAIERLGIRTLSVVPGPRGPDDALALTDAPDGVVAQSYGRLRTEVTAAASAPATILVSNCSPDRSATTTSANLALSLARAGFDTVLVDASVLGGQVPLPFRREGAEGLSDALFRDVGPERLLVDIEPHLRFLPRGGAAAAQRIGGPRMSEVIEVLTVGTHYLLIDAPSLHSADTQALSTGTDAILLVVDRGTTTLDQLRSALVDAERNGTRVLGAVLEAAAAKPRGRSTSPPPPSPDDEVPSSAVVPASEPPSRSGEPATAPGPRPHSNGARSANGGPGHPVLATEPASRAGSAREPAGRYERKPGAPPTADGAVTRPGC